MKVAKCKLCGVTTYSRVKEKNYCGDVKNPDSCAYKNAREKSGEWNRQSYYKRKEAEKEHISAHCIKPRKQYRNIELGWLNF